MAGHKVKMLDAVFQPMRLIYFTVLYPPIGVSLIHRGKPKGGNTHSNLHTN